jgi:hypothetical protein
VICGTYTEGSVKNVKRRLYSHLASDEITTRGYRVLTFAKSTTVLAAVLTVTSSLGFSREKLVWDGIGIVLV